ncbi:MAG TPA: Bcr/CflA family efflux MFS transporter [Chromatiaceae bacterium]|nr:Bcr/CflA family efflux MFS transporter [Chromatiaceae bacterium]
MRIQHLQQNMTVRLILILFTVPFSGMCIDIYVPSLPALTTFFHTTPQMVQLTVPAFLLGLGIAQVIFGTLSDSLGRRPLLLAGLLCSIVTFIGASMSPSIEWLLFWRFLQGIALASPAAIIKAVLTDSFARDRLAKVVNYTTMCWALGPIIAPAIGGYLQTFFHWQATFICLSIYALLLCIAIFFLLPETIQERQPLSLNSKINDMKLILANPIFLSLVCILILSYGYLLIFNVLGPFLVQHSMQYSAALYGQMAMVLGFGSFCGSMLNRFLLNYFSNQRLLLLAGICLLLASFVFCVVSLLFPLTLLTLVLPCFLLFAISSMAFTNAFGLILSLYPQKTGIANSLFGSILLLGTALITYIAGFTHLKSQRPMMWLYMIFSALALLLAFYTIRKFKHQANTQAT